MRTSRPQRASVVGMTLLIVVFGWSWVGAQSTPAPDIARGAHVADAIAGCTECHGSNLAGNRAFVLPAGTVRSANLTRGTGGIGGLSDEDLRRAIRFGTAPDGTALRLMPSRDYAVMTDADVADVIAYLRSLPPVDLVVPASDVPSAPAPGVAVTPGTVTGGAYLAVVGGCTNCHGAKLAGAIRPGGAVAPNISHAGIGAWTFGDFQTAMRTGKTPAGRLLSTAMPWARVGRLTDAELRSLYGYLESKSALAN